MLKSYMRRYNSNISGLKDILLLIIVINSFVIFFYQGSVFFSLLGESHQTSFVYLCTLNMLLVSLFMNGKVKINIPPAFLFIFISLFISLLATSIINKNSTAVRELLTLLVVTQLIIVFKCDRFIAFMNKLSSFHFAVLFVSFVIFILVSMGVIDYKSWDVTRLEYISKNNSPLYAKAVCCGRDVWNPLFFTLVSETQKHGGVGIGFNYERMMLIWNEPTGIPTLSVPLLLLMAARVGALTRSAILLFTVIIMLFAFSMTGFVVFSSLLVLYWLVKYLGVRLAMFLSACLLVILIANIEEVLKLLGGNKLDQYYGKVAVINFITQFSLFGLAVDNELMKYGYGTTLVYVRYGFIGYMLYLMVYIYMFYDVMMAFKDGRYFQIRNLLLSMAVLFSIITSLRSNQIVLPLPLLLYFYWVRNRYQGLLNFKF